MASKNYMEEWPGGGGGERTHLNRWEGSNERGLLRIKHS